MIFKIKQDLFLQKFDKIKQIDKYLNDHIFYKYCGNTIYIVLLFMIIYYYNKIL